MGVATSRTVFSSTSGPNMRYLIIPGAVVCHLATQRNVADDNLSPNPFFLSPKSIYLQSISLKPIQPKSCIAKTIMSGRKDKKKDCA